jgi:hypothetical protein
MDTIVNTNANNDDGIDAIDDDNMFLRIDR